MSACPDNSQVGRAAGASMNQKEAIENLLNALSQTGRPPAEMSPGAVRGLAQHLLAHQLEDGRVESRDERIARLRQTWPRAYEPWETDEEATLLTLYGEGASAASIASELGRPPGATRRRLEHLLGSRWRDRRGMVPGEVEDQA